MEKEDDSKVNAPSNSSSDSGDWQPSMQENWNRVSSSPAEPWLCRPWRLYLAFRKMRIVTTEPVLFLFMFALLMYSSMIEQYFLRRFSLEKLHNTSFPFPNGSESFCISTAELDKYGGNISDKVQASASHLYLYGMVPSQLLSVIAALTFGPLSDRFGRRPPMVLLGIGGTLNGLMSIGIMHFELNLNYFILPFAIYGLCGGFAGVISLSFSYIADVSSLKWRTLRIGILEAMIFAGGALGDGISGFWLNKLNCFFEPIIWLFTGANALIIVYVILFLPEPLTQIERLENAKNRPRGCNAVLQGFKIFFCSPWWLTWRLWVSLIALFVFVMNITGSNEITTLFLRNKPLDWNPRLIGIYQSSFQASHMIALLVILPILVALKLPDALIGLIGLAFNCGMNIFMGFVRQSWQMFVSKFTFHMVCMQLRARQLWTVHALISLQLEQLLGSKLLFLQSLDQPCPSLYLQKTKVCRYEIAMCCHSIR